MNYRYALGWVKTDPVGWAVYQLSPWDRITCRAGGLWPGITAPIPQGTPGGDFAQICRQEAQALWQQYNELVVMWSGGMDSSLLACLLAESKPAGATLVIASDAATLAQDSDVLHWLASKGCPKMLMNSQTLKAVPERGGMVVTGYHADTLLCGDIIRYWNLYETIWTMTVEEMLQQVSGLHPDAVVSLLQDLEPLLALMPVERTAANVAWWLDFTCAWDSDEMTAKFSFDLQPPGSGYINFYGADAFQLWSMQDVELKVGKTKATHKQIYKSMLTEVMGFTPAVPLNTEPGEDYGESMDMHQVLAIREDWSLVKATN